VWEFDTPVVLKYIRDPELASMPAVAISHDSTSILPQKSGSRASRWITACKYSQQSTNSSISAKRPCEDIWLQATRVSPVLIPNSGFSPDGRFVMSGDSQGMLWFWDWKSSKMFRKFKAHDGVVMGALWHPHESSKVATCSWDGTIKYWD
jgi:pre-mRNA-processing factor 17